MLTTLLLGVTLLGVVKGDQSDTVTGENQPMTEEVIGKRQMEIPEVVLQLKYERGELERVYLAQFRKPQGWSPSVSDRNTLCSDLCHAGLGGPICGENCRSMIPVGLQTALLSKEYNTSQIEYGHPRTNVCPVLCQNNMGVPLCQCASQDKMGSMIVDWNRICDVFCADGHTLGGCPACNLPTVAPSASMARSLTTAEGWSAWCDVQCRQGHGGAACNCDRTPFL